MPKLLLALADDLLSTEQQATIRQAAADYEVVQTTDEQAIAGMLDEIEIAVGQFPSALLPKATNLRWFQQWSAGADWLRDYPAVQTMDFILTSASGVHAIPISEHIFAFLLALARNLPQAWQAQQRHQWQQPDEQPSAPPQTAAQRPQIFELAGKTMLVIGVGEIGERTAQIAAALEMTVIGLRHNPAQELPAVDQMVGPDELITVLPKADIIVSTVPLTDETHHQLDEAAFAAMKKGVYLVNIGRGGTIDEAALIQALQTGQVAGAGLDVFAEEPLPADSPLWDMPNVLITPHSSGATPAYDQRALAIFLDNLPRYLAGEELRNVVDKKEGY
ncbi:MAG: D-2-hydroxyacid dehydrogenase [Caldilineaceae bacterium]|nr:D-2-hydroxyacid dehydrogenase [Caldilineaceae bacterium]